MGKQWKQWETILFGSKIIADGDCSHEIKKRLLLGRKTMTNLDSVLKSRDKGPYSQSYGFSNSHVWMWELDHKEGWAPKNWCFWALVLENTLKNPLDCKEINPEYSLEGLMLTLKLQYFSHLMRRADSLEKTLMLGKIEVRRRGQPEDKIFDGYHWLDGHEFEQAPGVDDGQVSLACCCPWGCTESDMTDQLNWTDHHHSRILHWWIHLLTRIYL